MVSIPNNPKRKFEIKCINKAHFFEFHKNFSHPLEKHDYWEMVYVDSGKITALNEGYARTLEQGELIFHKPMETHAHVSYEDILNSMLVISFNTDSPAMSFFDNKVFKLEKPQKTLLKILTDEAKENLHATKEYDNSINLVLDNSTPETYQMIECYFIELLIKLFRSENRLSSKMERSTDARMLGQNTLLELILEFMNNNINIPLTLKDICSQFYISNSKLCKLFNEFLQKSPIEYFNDLKIKQAKILLADNSKSITDVSDSLGYSSIHNFSRAFKNSVGTSPLEYRNKIL